MRENAIICPLSVLFLLFSSCADYAAPIGAFFCPEIRAFTGRDFFNRFQVLSDRKVLFKHKKWPFIAVNGR